MKLLKIVLAMTFLFSATPGPDGHGGSGGLTVDDNGGVGGSGGGFTLDDGGNGGSVGGLA